MKKIIAFGTISALVGIGLYLYFQHKHKKPTPPPVEAPAATLFPSRTANTRLTGQPVPLIDDLSTDGTFSQAFFDSIRNIPPQQFVGITAPLHRSTYIDELAANTYNNLSASDKALWGTTVGSNSVPSAAWNEFYHKWMGTGYAFVYTNFINDVKAGNVAAAQQYLLMASQFVYGPDHAIWGYNAGSEVGPPTFDIRQLAVSIVGNVLTLGFVNYNLKLINGVLSIVSYVSSGTTTTLTTPIPVPSLFLDNVTLISPSSVNKFVTDQSLSPIVDVTAPSTGRIIQQIYISPNAPNVYRNVTDSAVQNEFIKEMDQYKANPNSILNHAPGAVEHGFKIDPTPVK